MIIDERVSERDFGEFEGMPSTDFHFNAFWSYKQNLKYDKAENIIDFFKRVYDFLDSIKKQYPRKRISPSSKSLNSCSRSAFFG